MKRLLRTDNEALTVNWEVITENELNANKVKLKLGEEAIIRFRTAIQLLKKYPL